MADEMKLCPACQQKQKKLESLPPAQREQFKPVVAKCLECERLNQETEMLWGK